MKKYSILLMLVLGVSVLLGCAAARAEMVDKVIVIVNDEVVTQREFDRMFIPMKDQFEKTYKGEDAAQKLEEMKKNVLEQIVDMKLAVSLAKKSNVKIDQKEFERRVEVIKSYYPSEDEFLKTLSERGTNLTEFKKEIEEQMMAQDLVSKEVASKIVITPAEVKELYDKNKDKLKTPVTAKVRGILIRIGDDPAAARKQTEDIRAQIRSGADFAETAKKYSQAPDAQAGGDMGYVVKGELLEPLDQAIFVTKAGEVTEIVESEIGYHILKVEEVQASRDLTLEETNDFLKNQLFMKKFEENLVTWLAEKRKNAYISYK